MMQFSFPMRVRCVNARGVELDLTKGREYVATDDFGIALQFCRIEHRGGYRKERFKPIVRVKAPCIPSLELRVKRAIAAVERMTPQQQVAHWAAQRESWMRGNIGVD